MKGITTNSRFLTIASVLIALLLPIEFASASPRWTVWEENDRCRNNDWYRFDHADDNPTKSCDYISRSRKNRKRFCKWEEVHVNCPLACGVCCKDDDDYSFDIIYSQTSSDERDCQWLEEKESRKDKFCSKSNDDDPHDEFQNGKLIRNACRKTCDNCLDLIQIEKPQECSDLSTFSFPTFSAGDKDCEWLSKKDDRIRTYCGGRGSDGSASMFVKNACRNTCQDYNDDECDYVPSTVPSEAPSASANPTFVIDEECFDYRDFKFDTDYVGTKSCDWIDTATKRRNYCDNAEDVRDGDMIYRTTIGNICYEECFKEDDCSSFIPIEDDLYYSVVPSIVPSLESTDGCPTTICKERPTKMYLKFTADSCTKSSNSQPGFVCRDFGMDMSNDSYYIEVFNEWESNIYKGYMNVDDVVEIKSKKYDEIWGLKINVYTGSSKSWRTQRITIDTSCDNNLANGDTFGSMEVVGYKNDDQHVMCSGIGSTSPTCSNARCTSRPDKMFFEFTGKDCSYSDNSQFSVTEFYCDDIGDSMDDDGYYVIFRSLHGTKRYFEGFVQVGDIIQLNGYTFNNVMVVNVFTSSSKEWEKQFMYLDVSCSGYNLRNRDSFGSVKLMGFKSDDQNIKCYN